MWKNINRHYAINSKGQVKSLRYNRILKTHLDNGRERVGIRHMGKARKFYIKDLMERYYANIHDTN